MSLDPQGLIDISSMASAWTQHILKDITLEQCKRKQVNCIGSPSPIFIVMDVTTKVDTKKADTVIIKLGRGSKYTTPKFVGDTAKEAVCFICSF